MRFLRSGRFWLQFISIGGLCTVLLSLGLYLALLQIFSPERLQTMANKAVEGTGRNIHFSNDISRRWLPRPTVILSDVIISQPHSSAPAIKIQEMKLGMAWSNLWSDIPFIEKWVLKGADADLVRDNRNKWNLADLLQSPTNRFDFNRIQIEKGRLKIHTTNQAYILHNIDADWRNEDSAQPFQSSGILESPQFSPIKWTAEGQMDKQNDILTLPKLHATADTSLKNQAISLTFDSTLLWQNTAQTLTLSQSRLSADSPYNKLHVSLESPNAFWQENSLTINQINGIATAENSPGNHLSGSMKLGRTFIKSGLTSINSFELNGSLKTPSADSSLNTTGSAVWQREGGFNIDNLNLGTLYSAGKSPRPHFNSQLQGHITGKDFNHWQADLTGLLDRQPATFNAVYQAEPQQQAKITGQVKLQKLAFSPYWDDLQAQSGSFYPSLLLYPYMPEINANIEIDSFTMPGLQIDGLSTDVIANRERITLYNFKAGLYGGQSEGGVSITNTQPLSFHLQQSATGVQIRPLLQDLFGYHNIRGTGDAVIDLTGKGSERNAITKSLNGSLQLNVSDGAWLGIDMNNILQRAGNAATLSDDFNNGQQTPFNRFSLNSNIQNGIGYHDDTELISDNIRISSHGHTDLVNRLIEENLLIHNARDAAANPIPLKISGPMFNPSVTIDFQRLTYGLTTPEEKRRALAQTLREQWQWLNHGTPAPK